MSGSFYELDVRTAVFLEIKHHPGYLTPFSKHQAFGAWKNGSCVVKNGSDPGGDMTPDGTKGKILGSLEVPSKGYGYFVEWENKPKFAIFCVEEKMKLLEG